MKMQTRRGVKAARNVTVAAAAVFGLVLGSTGTAGAVVDDQNRIVSDGHEVIVTQEDTFIQGVPPIGGSPLSREWFHNGRGIANIVGPDAADFEGSTFQFGYQFAWSGSLDGSIGIAWSSPQAELEVAASPGKVYVPVTEPDPNNPDQTRPVLIDDPNSDNPEDKIPAYTIDPDASAVDVENTLTVDSILPQFTAGIELTPAPGIEELVVAEGEFDGDYKHVQFANVHGAATGVLGAVSVRPFVRVITANGDNVTTYGKVWTI
ncbi:MspA family porin [Rhodococcus ruber]|uniref:MspA family porin n=1 Tax=Rhodococcus TaxID=1827 RepID=UPI00111EAE7B|nr:MULTISPECIES: MspA family porin [Rhodococcus]MCZ1070667.1 MspA family porin [Rhodococcus sp. A5(2022)]QDC13608.1 porin [Rhodococcus ruber]QRE80127.1 MspA family porin [Rhodococcus ruber]